MSTLKNKSAGRIQNLCCKGIPLSYHAVIPGWRDALQAPVSSFKNKRAAVETVTSMLDKDGKWRVTGYFIK